MAGERAERFVDALHRLEERRDVGEILPLFAEDAEVSNPTHVGPHRGAEGVRAFWDNYLRTFGEVRSDFHNVMEVDGTAVLEWTSRGVIHNGGEVRYDGVSILEFDEGGKVRRMRAYFDPTCLGKQVRPAA